MSAIQAYVGLDVHKDTILVAITVRMGKVRFWGTILNAADELESLARKIATQHRQVEFVYEAGPCGYDVHRRLTKSVHTCEARHASNKDLKTARQRIQSYLLKYRVMYPGKAWSGRHRMWRANRQFNYTA